MTNCSFCFSDGDNRVLLKQVFIGIIFMSLDGVPLIAVVNTLSGFHFSLTRFSITVIINIIKEATQNPVLLPFGSIPNVWELFFYLCIGIVLRTDNGSSIPIQYMGKLSNITTKCCID